MTVFAVWLGLVCKRVRDQRLAVDRVAELRGFVGYDFEYGPDGARIANAQTPGRAWLRDLVGAHFFQHVVRVMLDETAVSDGDLRLIGRLKHVEILSLNDTAVSDAGLGYVSDLRHIRYLGLARTRVSDAGLRHVHRFAGLEDLILEETRIGDDGLRSLAALVKLKTLAISSTRVSSDGISSLSGLSNLEWLTLMDTAVDDAAIPHLTNFGRLTTLELSGTRLSGEGLSDLLRRLKRSAPSCHPGWDGMDLNGEVRNDSRRWQELFGHARRLDAENRLKLLDLSGSSVSDEDLSALVDLKNVQMIDLRGSRVTDAGRQRLKSALANCKIYP